MYDARLPKGTKRKGHGGGLGELDMGYAQTTLYICMKMSINILLYTINAS